MWGLAWTTNRTYGSGEKRFIQFCLSNRLMSQEGDILPASEGNLIYFASYLARTVKHSTIKLYLAAVRNLHISCGHGDPLSGKLLLKIKRSSGVFYATMVSHTFFVNQSLRGFYKPLSQFCTPGWGVGTLLWSGQPSLSPFLRSFAVASLLIRGFRDFAPRLTCPLTVCHPIPVWLPRSGCLFFLRLPRPTPFAKGTRLLLHAPPHRFAR